VLAVIVVRIAGLLPLDRTGCEAAKGSPAKRGRIALGLLLVLGIVVVGPFIDDLVNTLFLAHAGRGLGYTPRHPRASGTQDRYRVRYFSR
jgi:hypothetical protein